MSDIETNKAAADQACDVLAERVITSHTIEGRDETNEERGLTALVNTSTLRTAFAKIIRQCIVTATKVERNRTAKLYVSQQTDPVAEIDVKTGQEYPLPVSDVSYGAALRDLITRHTAFRNALLEVRNSRIPQVCDQYEICEHDGCKASYEAYVIADKALTEDVKAALRTGQDAETCIQCHGRIDNDPAIDGAILTDAGVVCGECAGGPTGLRELAPEIRPNGLGSVAHIEGADGSIKERFQSRAHVVGCARLYDHEGLCLPDEDYGR
jgi:hypothetical protein